MAVQLPAYRLAASLAMALGAAIAATPASAVTLCSDDFESYAAGSDLVGQGGWASGAAGSAAQINAGSYLPSQVLDGCSALGAGLGNVVARAVADLDAGLVGTLSFDAYATTDAAATHNMAVFLTDEPSASLTKAAGWFPVTSTGWTFTVGNDVFDVAGGYDMPVRMSLVIDGPAGEAWRTYDFGGGVQQTPHDAVAGSCISALDTIYIFIDHRGSNGMEIDNLVLAVPEPSTVVLFGLGGLRCTAAPEGQARASLRLAPGSLTAIDTDGAVGSRGARDRPGLPPFSRPSSPACPGSSCCACASRVPG